MYPYISKIFNIKQSVWDYGCRYRGFDSCLRDAVEVSAGKRFIILRDRGDRTWVILYDSKKPLDYLTYGC